MVHHVAAATDPNLQLTLRVLPAIVVILIACLVCGRLALSVGQPRVLGEMVAGVLLGPTLLGWIWPHAQEVIFPPQVKPVLYVVSVIGLTLYMFLVGVGLDHGTGAPGEVRKAIGLAAAGVVPTCLLAGLTGAALWSLLSSDEISRLRFALYIGGALSLTAFPMLARILYERGLQNSQLGRLSLFAASIDDALAWCLLALLSALHLGHGPLGAVRTIVLTALFAAVILTVVPRLLRPLGEHAVRTGDLGPAGVYVVILVPLMAGWLTDWIGVYSVFGGFLAGLAMPRDPRFRDLVHARMMDFVSTLLLPVFFVFSGLNTSIRGIAGGEMLLAFLAILTVAFVGKYFGCALAMRGFGFRWRESWAVGGLMNARGLMILIFANIGLAQGMINRDVFAMLVLVAVITTAAAVPLYRLALPEHEEPAPQPELLPTAGAR